MRIVSVYQKSITDTTYYTSVQGPLTILVPKPVIIVLATIVSLMTTPADYFPCTARKKILEEFHNIHAPGELEVIYSNRVVKPLTRTGTFRANVLAKSLVHNKALLKSFLS
jgi:hypothetical protein